MSKNAIQNIPITNRLLGALPADEYQLLFPKLELFDLVYARVVQEPKQLMEYMYFPNSGIISLSVADREKSILEIAMIGKEGAFGLPIFLSDPNPPAFGRVIVQGAGSAMRIKAADLLAFCASGGALPEILKQYTYRFTQQIVQSLVCNNFHQTEARLARWLMMMRDRIEDDKFPVTQSFMSDMLGVRREAVTRSAGSLQRQRLISYYRGHLEIINLEGLQAAACPCYALFREIVNTGRKSMQTD